ncbi:MAG: very short patch repair endonuclease [Bacteroidota bacterium]
MSKKVYLRDGRAPIPQKESISKLMSANKDRGTKPEISLRRALWKNGIRGYRLNLKNLPGKPDLSFPSRKLAVFVNGCFWHRCPYCKLSLPKSNTDFWENKFKKNVARDKRKINDLKMIGWDTIAIWECEIKSDMNTCLEKIRKAIDENGK